MADFIGNTPITTPNEWEDVTGTFANKIVAIQSTDDDVGTLIHIGPDAPTTLNDGFFLPPRPKCYPAFTALINTKLWVRTTASHVHVSEVN